MLFKFFKYHMGFFGFILLFSGIFVIAFALYDIPLKAAAYPGILCAVILLLYLIFDFLKKKREHNIITSMRDFTSLSTPHLPEASSISEEDYKELVRLLLDEHRRFEKDTFESYNDMIDYYTIWAHQIKTPIASMRLTLQEEDTPFSRRLTGELFKIEQYVEMVLAFLRLDSASTDYVLKEYSLDDIIRRSIKKYAGEFIAKKLSLSYTPTDAKVLTDEKWLSFVIEQVISNAIKYTSSGSIQVSVSPEKVLRIADTGIGIADEDLPRVFEKGYTGYNGRTDKKASGIGLYLCRRICSNLGHNIYAKSSPGRGTEIFIDLSRKNIEFE